MPGCRAQTEFDYVIGMTLVLLTLPGVLLFVPGIFQPFEDPVSADEGASADRLVNNLLSKISVDGSTESSRMPDHLRRSGC